jgi:hypothetical protein
MKSRNARIAIRISLGIGIILLFAPLLAGYFQIGDRDGPVFYPESLHTPLYILAHEAANEGKPRMSLAWSLYDRPSFWGLPRRPKSEAVRDAYIERSIERHGLDSYGVRLLLEEQQRISNGQQAVIGNRR